MNGIHAGAATTEYLKINDALNRIFFDGRFKLAPIYLDLEDDLLDEAAHQLGIESSRCLEAIAAAAAATLQTGSGQSPYAWHLNQLSAWVKHGRFDPPPFTALLTALSLAAERMRADAQYSAQNYYERLFEVLGVADETYKNRLKQSAYCTKDFWEGLNFWLAARDFDFGRPTAKPVNNWEYAGYPLSQALVRKGDRQRMHACFSEFGLAPHEKLTEGEMTQYLHDWMRGQQPSAWLKRIWSNFDLRPRVAAAACAELEIWDGGEERDGDELAKRRLSWAASLQTFPSPVLRMYLSTAPDGEDGVPGISLQSGAPAAAAAAFAGTQGQLRLSPTHDGAINILEPVSKIALNPLMLASFALEAPDADLKFVRSARPIIPLVKPDTGPYFREVSRVSFLRQHLVLCHTKWREAAANLLLTTARQGFREWTPEQLPGLPEDWVLFSGVEILRPAETSDPDFSALTPLAEGITIEMSGGLRLAQGIYHCLAAPEITASTPQGRLRLRIADAQSNTIQETPDNASSHRLDLSAAAPWQADTFTICAEAGAQQRTTQISFRSADNIKHVSPGALDFAYELNSGEPRRALSSTAGALRDTIAVQGMIVSGAGNAAPPALTLQPAEESAAGEEEPLEPEGSYQLHRVPGLQETCLLRGHHEWKVDYVPPWADQNAPVWMMCKDCSLRVLSAGNRTRPRGYAQRANRGPRRREGPPVMRPRVSPATPPGLVYDALCYLSSGSWARFSDIVASSGHDALSYHVWASNLTALGFLDLSYDAALRAPVSWSIPAPALVFITPEKAFLSGFRNDALTGEVRERLRSSGAVETMSARARAPDAIFFDGLREDQCESILADVKDARGRSITVISRAGLRIAVAHPPASSLETLMTPIGIDAADELKQFDPAAARWRSAENTRTPGAYRADYTGRRYFLVEADGAMKAGPYWLVKLLAAKRAGIRLHGYDSSRGAFQAVLGCGLPPLLERALAASSGHTPVIERGKLIYGGVSQELAAHVLAKLYS